MYIFKKYNIPKTNCNFNEEFFKKMTYFSLENFTVILKINFKINKKSINIFKNIQT